MMVPCMKSSSEMQIKANVLLWKAERFICGRSLSRDPAVGQSWFLFSQREWVWGEELFLMGVSLRGMSKSVRPFQSFNFSPHSSCMDEYGVAVIFHPAPNLGDKSGLNITTLTWLSTLEDTCLMALEVSFWLSSLHFFPCGIKYVFFYSSSNNILRWTPHTLIGRVKFTLL